MVTTVVLAGGGTAGHVNPLLATAQELSNRGARCHIVGTSQGLEKDLVPAAGYELRTIARVPLPRKPSLDLLRLPANMKKAVGQAGRIIDGTRADVVVGFGGYVSTPMYLAAKKRGVPIVIHEQNAKPGLANKLGARWASFVGITFASTPLKARRGKTACVGLPLRPAIYELARQKAADRHAVKERCAKLWDLNPARPIIVVTGGSLGAVQLNDAWCEAMDRLPADLQVIHLSGKGKDAPVIAARARAGLESYRIKDYEPHMEDVLGCADLVICRSGAGTVSEMSALGIPAVYVPLAIGNGEQRLNAADVVRHGGALLVANRDFGVTTLFNTVLPLAKDASKLEAMSSKAAETGKIEAASLLADAIEAAAQRAGNL